MITNWWVWNPADDTSPRRYGAWWCYETIRVGPRTAMVLFKILTTHYPPVKGGPTNWQNGSGLCAACNQIKENTGWRHEATPEQLTVTTPTGHQYAKPTGPVLEGIPPDTRASANQEPSSQVRSSTDCYAAKPHRPIVLTLAA